MVRAGKLVWILVCSFWIPFCASSAAADDPSVVDQSVERALEYLQRTQQASGAWVGEGNQRSPAVTALSVMAFLSAGHVPGEGKYGECVAKGLDWVLQQQHANGLIAPAGHQEMYHHGICTLMLAEVVGMTDAKQADEIRRKLVKAVEVILVAQRTTGLHRGGWRYTVAGNDGDISVTGWQIMALRAAKSAGCSVPSENIDRALDYLKRCAYREEGGFGYQPGGGPNNPRTGTGILALEICGEHESPEAVAGAEYLLRHPPRWASSYFFYEVYYCPQALFQMGDKYFLAYYPKLVAILLDHQDANGSWLSGDGNDRSGGRVYCTAMAVLALAVEYRYLPIYQR
jgi:Prenyltransferase and squalene oxidase repeat